MSESIHIERTPQGVVTLTFDRPEVHHAFDWAMQTHFRDLVQTLVADKSVRALILTGAGNSFCAGGDLRELADYPSREDGARLATIMGDSLDQLEGARFPVIAAINGHALGGGAEITTACDLRIMDERAKLGFVQISLALTPGWGAATRLVNLLGYSQAMHILLMAQPLTAAECLAKGLIQTITPAGESLPQAHALAERIAGWDAKAVSDLKLVLQAGKRLPYERAKEIEYAAFPDLWAGQAHLDAVQAFLNRKSS